MGWRERDWAQFTDAERKALYGAQTANAEASGFYNPPASRPRVGLAPGAGIAVAVTIGVLSLGQFPRAHPILPALHIGSPGIVAPAALHTFPLNLSPAATYGSVLTINGTDPSAVSGTVVASGQWNGGAWVTLGSTALAADHTWSVPISMSQHGTLDIRISLPSGNSLLGAVTVQP